MMIGLRAAMVELSHNGANMAWLDGQHEAAQREGLHSVCRVSNRTLTQTRLHFAAKRPTRTSESPTPRKSRWVKLASTLSPFPGFSTRPSLTRRPEPRPASRDVLSPSSRKLPRPWQSRMTCGRTRPPKRQTKAREPKTFAILYEARPRGAPDSRRSGAIQRTQTVHQHRQPDARTLRMPKTGRRRTPSEPLEPAKLGPESQAWTQASRREGLRAPACGGSVRR